MYKNINSTNLGTKIENYLLKFIIILLTVFYLFMIKLFIYFIHSMKCNF